jgi:hypothetical protein
VSQIEQELITLVEHYNSPVVLGRVPVAGSLVFCVMSEVMVVNVNIPRDYVNLATRNN